MAAIRVLVVDDEESVVDVLRTLIGSDPSLELVGEAHDAERGIQLTLEREPDVVLMDVRMPGGGGVRAVREITRRYPRAGVVALSAHEDDDTRIRMIGAGARDYVPKSESTDAILAAIHRTASTGRSASRRARSASAGTLEELEERRTEQRVRVERALRSGSIATTFRPIVDLETGVAVGIEAQPQVAVLPRRPFDAWIGDAEAVDLLVELELAAVRSAREAIHALPGDVFVEIEVSPSTALEARFRSSIRSSVAPRLVLTISELSNPSADLGESIASLRERGVRLTLGDVGPNVAGLGHLATLAPEFVRLDRGLTDGVQRDPTRHAVVAAVAACAREAGASVVAEGVTDRSQAEELRSLGVQLAQEELGPPQHLSDLVTRGLGSSGWLAGADIGAGRFG
jgi:DNA-binding NarL/FixJ family response regulator